MARFLSSELSACGSRTHFRYSIPPCIGSRTHFRYSIPPCQHDPAQAEDFETPWEEYPGRFPEPTITNCGLSIHTDSQDSEKLKNRIKKFRKRQIAEGELNPTLGVIQRTPSLEKSHHSWWIPLGAEPWGVFNIIGG